MEMDALKESFCLSPCASLCRSTAFDIHGLVSISTRRWPRPPSSHCPVKTPSSLPSDWAGSSKNSARYGYEWAYATSTEFLLHKKGFLRTIVETGLYQHSNTVTLWGHDWPHYICQILFHPYKWDTYFMRCNKKLVCLGTNSPSTYLKSARVLLHPELDRLLKPLWEQQQPKSSIWFSFASSILLTFFTREGLALFWLSFFLLLT